MLVLTSALHYFAVPPLLCKFNIPWYIKLYIYTILLSTTTSIIWHYTGYLLILDYVLAGFWFFQDVLWSLELEGITIILLNLLIFCLNIVVLFLNNYELYHSIWHVISAIKCIYVSYLISKIII